MMKLFYKNICNHQRQKKVDLQLKRLSYAIKLACLCLYCNQSFTWWFNQNKYKFKKSYKVKSEFKHLYSLAKQNSIFQRSTEITATKQFSSHLLKTQHI